MSNQDISISPVTLNGFTFSGIDAPYSTSAVVQTPGITQAVVSNGIGAQTPEQAAIVSISLAAQFYSELQQLLARDPGMFKQVLTHIIGKLNTATLNSAGEEQQFLATLTQKFQQAAHGDLSGLQPSPLPTSEDLLPHILPPVSELGNLVVGPQAQTPINPNLLTLQLQQATLGDLLFAPNLHPLSAIGDLFALQPPIPATIGDLFLPQSHTTVNLQHLVAVYGHKGQLLTEAFPTQDAITYHAPFSPGTQQALDSIVQELHTALFGSSNTP
ncbi:MAG TPA: hypothetical protein VKU00_12995 [Chthonomonadaceae bacterium]|nr:hypothetical protein [Chthonomonadaceae bacterium]